MSGRIVGFFGLVAFLVIAPLANAQDFSADVVSTRQDGNGGRGKIYSTKDKVRWETQDQNSSMMGMSAIVIDEAQGKNFVLIEQRHMYVESFPGMTRMPLIAQFWHVQDVGDACPQWKRMAEQYKTDKNWGSCTKVGNDTVNGRSAVKYEGVSTKGEKSYYWIDTKLKCVIKGDSPTGGMELRNIQEGPQPASLFEIPAGYTKFDMGGMMGPMGKQP